MESSAFNEWKGVGGYAEVFSKYPSYFLHPLFKLRPRKTSLSAVSNYATQFGQSTQCLPSPIWVFALIVLKAKLRVISRFVRLAIMNLNPLITQERDFPMLPHRRRPIARLRDCLISCVVYPLSQLEEPPHETS